MALSNCSHWSRKRPTAVVKKVGKKTRKPNCAAVLIIRTTQPLAVFGFSQGFVMLRPPPPFGGFGFSQAIVKLEVSESRVFFLGSPGRASRVFFGSPASA